MFFVILLFIFFLMWFIFFIFLIFFFFNDTATTEIYTLSLHDALPILTFFSLHANTPGGWGYLLKRQDRKSTRLNSSHANISYAVFCLKKKKKTNYCRVVRDLAKWVDHVMYYSDNS